MQIMLDILNVFVLVQVDNGGEPLKIKKRDVIAHIGLLVAINGELLVTRIPKVGQVMVR